MTGKPAVRAGVIINRHAKLVARDPELPGRLADIAGGAAVCVETHAVEELPGVVADFRARGVRVIAICGGDGTNLYALTAIMRGYAPEPPPVIALLRGGTINIVAKNLGIQGRPEDLLRRVVAAAAGAGEIPAREVELQTMNGHAGFIFGSGLVARVFEPYYAGGGQGAWKATRLAFQVMGSGLVGGEFAGKIFAPVRARIAVDGTEIPNRDFTLLLASKVVETAVGFRPTYRALERGTTHLVASGLTPARLTMNALHAQMGWPMWGQPHADVLAREIDVRFEAASPWLMDGELMNSDHVRVTAGPVVRLFDYG